MLNDLRPPANYPKYPPYHEGGYLEEYFYNWWKSKNIITEREYIDIFWTNIYCNSGDSIHSKLYIQKYLDSLDFRKKYFTVCQHDNGPLEHLPPDTKIFSAGGNRTFGNIIPIPLICSKIKETNIDKPRDILCSFIGSETHPIRNSIYETWKDDEDFHISYKKWSFNVSNNDFLNFKNVTERSIFSLCPRGYGLSSFRLYESIQLGAIPVYISDKYYLPWTDELDWNEFCVMITPDNIKNLKSILLTYEKDDIKRMSTLARELYRKYFSLDGLCEQILKRIND